MMYCAIMPNDKDADHDGDVDWMSLPDAAIGVHWPSPPDTRLGSLSVSSLAPRQNACDMKIDHEIISKAKNDSETSETLIPRHCSATVFRGSNIESDL